MPIIRKSCAQSEAARRLWCRFRTVCLDSRSPPRALGSGRLERHRYAVHAVAQAGWGRAVIEDVAEMAAAAGAEHFGARLDGASIGAGDDRVRQRAKEARPARSALEFGGGRIKR